jgi:ceramide glucosyltransferase
MDILASSVDVVLFILCLAAIWFYSYATYAAIEFFRSDRSIDPNFHPPVTILKPICGLDREIYENLASFCRQDYPEYQIVFAVRDRQDPAVEVVEKIISEFTHLDIQLVASDRTIGANLKVSNLANAEVAAKYPLLLIADSDIRVGSDYLQRVIQPLKDPQVGVVTCMYRSLAQGWVSTLEAIGTATDFHPGVLVARKLGGMKFALGSTIAIPRATLEAIGGFTAIADYLADDFLLGHLPVQKDYRVVLSDYIVEHVLTADTFISSIQRQIRWARGIRVSRLWGYLGLILTYGTVNSLLFLIATGGSTIGWAILATTWCMRLTMAWVVGASSLKDKTANNFLWLVPLRDLLSFTVWCYSFLGNTIQWRGCKLLLTKGGKLVPF